MHEQNWRWIACGLPLLALLAHSAAAGQAVDVRILDRTAATPATYRVRMLLDAQAFTVDTTALRGRPSSLLCRQDDAVYLLDRQARQYMAFNLQALSGTSSMMRKAGELLAPGMGDYLPESATAGPCVVSATNRRREIAGLPCQLFQVTRDGVKLQEIWVAPWSAVQAPRQSFDLLRGVAAAWSTIAAALNAAGTAVPAIPLDGYLQLDGYPVLFSHYASSGRPLYEARFSAPRPVTTTATDFAVPANYTRSFALPASGPVRN